MDAVLAESIFRDVWESLSAIDGDVESSFARSGHEFPLLTSVLFYSAVRSEFHDQQDVRVITRAIGRAISKVPNGYLHLFAPREAEALIRAQVFGETDLLSDYSVASLELRNTVLALTRSLCQEVARSQPDRKLFRLAVLETIAEYRSPNMLQEMLISLLDPGALRGGGYEDLLSCLEVAARAAMPATASS
ncbi:hypothetical protein ACEZCY_06725 [Streptacidiphilus sp. N1-12]|uniref:Uncharacterized protein n=2 Tax=Streptacidiphilus alkalitolerans TaxID=3342712 RepID=A0ABV6WA56_9ACTN